LVYSLLSSCVDSSTKTQNVVEFEKNSPSQIVFDTLKHDFGTIVRGEKVAYAFRFTNKGGKPAFVKNVKAECGCTAVDFDKEAINPGHSGRINVVFDSEGYAGNTFKSVKIFTNASQEAVTLEIAVFVKVQDIIDN